MVQKQFYKIDKNKDGEEYIKCLICGLKSYLYRDIENHYCGNCKKFLDIEVILRELSWHEKRDLELKEFFEKSEAFQGIYDDFSFEDMDEEEWKKMVPDRSKYRHLSEAEMQTIYMGHLTGLFKSLKDIGVI